MKAIIIDDEQRARVSLKHLLAEYCPEVELMAECENLPEGVKAIRKYKPDLVLLDIEMPGHSGLELLDFFNEDEINFSVVFTTAYNEYAIQAFKLSAIDYLLKPIAPDDLTQAIDRVDKHLTKIESYKLLRENLTSNTYDRIAVPSGNTFIFIKLNEIMYIKGEGSYTDLVLTDNSRHTVSRNLKNFEEIVCVNPNFVRIHKSYIVNIEMLKSMHRGDGGSVELTNGKQLPVSPDKADAIFARIQMIKR